MYHLASSFNIFFRFSLVSLCPCLSRVPSSAAIRHKRPLFWSHQVDTRFFFFYLGFLRQQHQNTAWINPAMSTLQSLPRSWTQQGDGPVPANSNQTPIKSVFEPLFRHCHWPITCHSNQRKTRLEQTNHTWHLLPAVSSETDPEVNVSRVFFPGSLVCKSQMIRNQSVFSRLQSVTVYKPRYRFTVVFTGSNSPSFHHFPFRWGCSSLSLSATTWHQIGSVPCTITCNICLLPIIGFV